LNVQWLFVSAAFLLAVGALLRARRVAKRLERLTESYWELRYESGQLRARVARLEPSAEPASPDPEAPVRAPANFVPLSSLKR
jgi:hypothetical protein